MRKFALFLVILPLLTFASDLDLLYDDSQVAIIEITMDPQGLLWMYDNVQSDSMHLASMHFSNAFIDETVENIGFRLRGNTSRDAQKKSFKVSINSFVPGRKFYDVEKLNLNGEHNDPSIMRSKIAWDYYQQTNLASTRAAHCALYINEVYYGLYISIEHIDEEFIQNHFEDDSGNLWKCLWPADLTYRGPDPEDYHPYNGDSRPYELKTNTEAYDYSKLAELITLIHDTPGEDLADSLEKILLVPEVLKYAAMNVLMGNWDDYWFLMNNYYLYHEPRLNRFHFIPFDYDNSFGIDWFNVDWTQVNPYTFMTIEESQGNSPGSRPLMEKIMANDQYHNLYTHFLEYYRSNIAQLDLWETRLDSLKDMITPWAELDSFRTYDYGFTIPEFHQSFSPNDFNRNHVKKGLKQFINERNSSLSNQINYIDAPPIIYDLQYWPLIPGPEDSIYVSVAAFSPEGLDHVTIAFHPGALTVVLSYPMTYTPAENPASVEQSDRWIGVIPPLGNLGSGRFQVSADDVNGQSMIFPRQDFIAIQAPGNSEIQLHINELLANNETVNTDDAGEFDDWLELVNMGTEDLLLSGYYLTDDPNNLTKWMFPFGGLTIEAGNHMLVWCDEDQEQPGIHTNFKLSASGEFLALIEPDGETVVDALNFGVQEPDVSYGRAPDGADVWVYFNQPTPGSSNGSSSIDHEVFMPTSLELTNFPNPFNAQTIIRYHLPENGYSSMSIFDLKGREVKHFFGEVQTGGDHTLSWNSRNDQGDLLPAGIYFIQLHQAAGTATQKILILK